MRRYLTEYVKEIEEKLQGKVTKEDLQELKIKIEFFQHERFIHLCVTLSYAFLAVFFLVAGLVSYWFLIPFFGILIFLLFYIVHYFFLENSVQYLYKLYDKMNKLC